MVDDLLAGARALSTWPDTDRQAFADRMLVEAHAAHLYAKRFGHPHPRWGNGSLMARALAAQTAVQLPPQPCYAALAVMADAIARFRARMEGTQRHGLGRRHPIC